VTPLKRDPAFRTLWLGQIGSAIGRETARIALPLQVYLLTGSAAAIGLLALMQLVPTLVFALAGGAVADVVDRRRLLFFAQTGMAIASGLLLTGALTAGVSVAMVLILAAVIAAFFAVEHPARISSVPRLVAPERLGAAVALTSLNFQASSVIGPAVAGVLIAIWGLPSAYVLQVLAYASAALMALRIPPIHPEVRGQRPSLAGILEGVRFVRQRRLILSVFAIDFNAMVFGLPVALFPVLAIQVFGIGPAGVGLLAAARGSGAFLAAILSGWIPSVRQMGRAVLGVVVVWAAATTLLGFAGFSLVVGVVLIALAGAADLISAVFRTTIVQTATPDEIRGRVSSLYVLAASSGPRIGEFRAAIMAEALSAQAALSLGGVVALLGVVLVARVFPELASYERVIRPAATLGEGTIEIELALVDGEASVGIPAERRAPMVEPSSDMPGIGP
jgi:MFS family permease